MVCHWSDVGGSNLKPTFGSCDNLLVLICCSIRRDGGFLFGHDFFHREFRGILLGHLCDNVAAWDDVPGVQVDVLGRYRIRVVGLIAATDTYLFCVDTPHALGVSQHSLETGRPVIKRFLQVVFRRNVSMVNSDLRIA